MVREVWVVASPGAQSAVAEAISAVNSAQDTWRLFAKDVPDAVSALSSPVQPDRAAAELTHWARGVPAVWVTDEPLRDRWFSHHYAACAVISTDGLSDLELGFPEVAYVAYELAQALTGFWLAKSDKDLFRLCHDPAVGCLLDLCSYKPDIRRGMAAGRLCSRCAVALRELGLTTQASDSLSHVLQYVAARGSLPDWHERPVTGDGMLSILHLSDLHYGSAFRFAPGLLRPGQPPVYEPCGNLTDPCELILSDLEGMSTDPDLPPQVRSLAAKVDLVVLSGDTANTAAHAKAIPLRANGPDDEYDQAAEFIGKLMAGIQRLRNDSRTACGTSAGLVVVPGNHDVDWAAGSGSRQRFLGYARFCHAVSGNADYLNSEPNEIVCYREVAADRGLAVVVGFNSCTMSSEQENLRDIGIVENEQLDAADAFLHGARDIPRRKIAVVHHHPLSIPPVAAEYNTYDAIVQAGRFLSYLQDRGFDLILHGHKHYPMAWVHNMRSYEATKVHGWSDPVVVSGGSLTAQADRLPLGVPNVYHLIGLRVAMDSVRPRCVIARRSLPLGGLLHGAGFAGDGIWYLGADHPPSSTAPAAGAGRPWEPGTRDESERAAAYAASDGWMLVHRYRRSPEPEQLFDISIYLAPHKKRGERKQVQAVTYDVGRLWPGSPFRIEDPGNGFELRLSAYGPFLCLASVEFQDGSTCALQRYVDFEMSDLLTQ